eukprot:m.451719 g.451719  ORF g.451719 m.451719 type:complete len:99 (-) comp20195_c0_seq1:172-468(-)
MSSAAASERSLFNEVKPARGKGKHAVQSARTLRSPDDAAILKDFDLNTEYGPCVGISRLDRWERAKRNGLNPPNDVLQLIQQNSGSSAYTQNLWNDRL